MHEKNIIIKTKDGNLDCKVFINSNINAPTVIFYMDAPGIREELRTMCRRILDNGYNVLLPNLFYRVGTEGNYPFNQLLYKKSKKKFIFVFNGFLMQGMQRLSPGIAGAPRKIWFFYQKALESLKSVPSIDTGERDMYKLNKTVVCADGFSMSVQAGTGNYCKPRQPNADRYTAVEVGFPSHEEPLLLQFQNYLMMEFR